MYTSGEMKIAVTTNNSKSSSEVASTFARAPWVLVYDTESKTWESHENSGTADVAHGAGTQAAEFISRLGVVVLISSACGPCRPPASKFSSGAAARRRKHCAITRLAGCAS